MARIPKPTGEYAVGTFTFTVKDVREEALAPGTMRSVPCRVYYPARKESVEGLPKMAALSENMLRGYKRSFKVAPDFKKHPEARFSECYVGAEPVPGKRFPLILFNHAYLSYREGNSFLCIELASHGYAVISVAHPLEGMCTEFDDGTALFPAKGIAGKMYRPMLGGILAMYKLMKAGGTEEEQARGFDENQRKYCRYMMDRLPEWVKDNEAALAYAKENLGELIDFSGGVGVSGHSMGGDAAYALSARNPDVACGINMDGGLFGDYSRDVLTKPFLQLSCKDNENVVTRVYLRHTAPVWKVLFRDMKHIGFSDAKYLIHYGSMTGRLDPDLFHENLCKCHLEFFDAFLKGMKAAPALESNDVMTVRVYEPDM